jgi:enolase-phosphatase E1
MSAERLYLLDIEGTVAPLTLTTQVLFPYARAHFEQFLLQSEAETQLRIARGEDELAEGSVWRDLIELGFENRNEPDPEAPRIWPARTDEPSSPGKPRMVTMTPDEAIPKLLEYVYWLMDRDRKSTALKSLQGKIWKAGFESGELKGTLFADVPEAFARWAARGKVAIYSSGSVEAQQLLFRYSNYGDLTPYLSGYFDTRTGPKAERASYAAIAEGMGVAPGEAIFFSDAVRELDAAREAEMATRLVVREGNAAVEDARGHERAHSFDLLS